MAHSITEIPRNSANKADQILYEYFLPEYRKGYVEIDANKCCLPVRYTELADQIDQFQVHDTDVFVVSYPKTGTTWVQEMVWCITNDLDYAGAQQPLPMRSPFIDYSILYDYRHLSAVYTPPAHMLDMIAHTDRCPDPRLIKTHLPWQQLPKQVTNGEKKCKIIYVTRNPLDTCVSYYHHTCSIEGYTGNINDFVTLYVNGRVCYGSYCTHAVDFWRQRGNENLLFLRYEDMKMDLAAQVRKVAAFFNKTLGDDQVASLVQHLSFDAMKNNPAVNQTLAQYKTKTKSARIRTGKMGGYKTELTPEMIDKINTWVTDQLKNTDFQF